MSRVNHIVGNWKMNQDLGQVKEFFGSLETNLDMIKCEAWISPQFIHLAKCLGLSNTMGGKIKCGPQTSSHKNSGAFTGDVSPASIKDLGAHFVIIGHSERRAFFEESDQILNQKMLLALENGLKVIFCVGETLEEREAGKMEEIVLGQLDNGLKDLPADKISDLIIAYEPVWAIGTGQTATPRQAEEVHALIRPHLDRATPLKGDDLIILYGGSVKPSNITELLSQPDIDGALVGGASLNPKSFLDLCVAGSL
ncbi:MAG: triose-phosphate isomerase [Bdellovibrionales bacterium]|jgi:triosephosphate isomerase (TIM)|nr:triose-phosphate isomerase [Bdellovibrionales bacterium]MBT3524932.1 triose-phosphate isomerase [Bdellovibrionales bacterium]MBT7767443.1 triose-phosphate isomerase [Bdellovibrionales bacterium]